MSQGEKAVAFQALHRQPGCFVIPNPWDRGSARMLAKLGFKALATTSAGFDFASGRPEGTARLDDVLAHCRDLVAATDLPVSADLYLGELTPKDVTVEVYFGALDAENQIDGGIASEMQSKGDKGDGIYRFAGAVRCDRTGQQGFTIRVLPNHADLAQKHETTLITWA